MTKDEQNAHYAKLLLDERQTERKLACLESRIRETKEALNCVFMQLESSQLGAVSRAEEQYAEIDSTDILSLIREKKETMAHLYAVQADILAIEGRRP